MRKNFGYSIIIIAIISVLMYAFGKLFFWKYYFLVIPSYKPLQLNLSILLTSTLFIIAFMCGIKKQKWFVIGIMTPFILFIGVVALFLLSALINNFIIIEFIFKIVFEILYYGFVAPFQPLSLFIHQLFSIKVSFLHVLSCFIIYPIIFCIYFVGKTISSKSNTNFEEEIKNKKDKIKSIIEFLKSPEHP